MRSILVSKVRAILSEIVTSFLCLQILVSLILCIRDTHEQVERLTEGEIENPFTEEEIEDPFAEAEIIEDPIS